MNESEKIANSCDKATFLVEKKQLAAIETSEEMELNFHLAGCPPCRLFQKQSVVINQMIHDAFYSPDYQKLRLDNDFKIELQTKIDQKLGKL